MKPNTNLLALTASLIAMAPLTAAAYPIFYKCDANRNLSEVLTGSELAQKLTKILALPDSQRQQAIETACAGLQDCERQLEQVAELAEIDRALTEKVFENELKKLTASQPASPIQKLSPEVFETQKMIQSTAFQVTACRNTIASLSTEKFATSPHDDEGSIFIYYPYHSEYTYVTGCRPFEDGKLFCNPNQKKGIKTAIRNALLGGVDPYVYLALGLMEDGANGWRSLKLDPIGKMKAMSCREEASNLSDESTQKLWSYGNSHKIAPGVSRDASLSARLNRYLSGKGIEPGLGKSYFCRSTTGTTSEATSDILSAPPGNQCCLELGFDLNTLKLRNNPNIKTEIENAFVADHLRNIQNKQLAGKTDPAFRLQQFNGFSRLMGGAEPVSTFRSGVNYYENPAYGYQAMDFIINSLATNPWIRTEIERQSKELQIAPPSILCMDVAVPGTFQIDSDSYFKKHHDAPRLKTIRGKSYASLTSREKNVLNQEMYDASVRNRIKKQFGDLPKELKTTLDAAQPTAAVIVLKAKDGTGIKVIYSAEGSDETGAIQVKKLGKYTGAIPTDLKSVNALGVDLDKAKKGFAVTLENTKSTLSYFGGYAPTEDEFKQVVDKGYSLPTHDEYRVMFSNGVTYKVSKRGNTQVREFIDAQGKPIEHVDFNSYSDQNFRVELSDGSGFSVQFETLPKEKTPPAGTKQIAYSDGTEYSLSSDIIPATPIGKSKSSVSIEKAVSYYWKEIYPSRDTISKASPLPWTKMPDSLLKEIAEKVRSESQ
ncbi:MAG: hypothetical protein ACJ763_10570 [Bdellovibrionia bacterium]